MLLWSYLYNNFVNNKYLNLKLNIYQRAVDSRLKVIKYLLLRTLFIKIQ